MKSRVKSVAGIRVDVFRPEEDDTRNDGPAVFGNMLDMDKTIREMMKIADMPDGCKFSSALYEMYQRTSEIRKLILST